MKKWSISIFILAVIIALSGCQNNEPTVGNNQNNTPVWREVIYNNQTFIEKTSNIPVTDIKDATVLATGTETDVAFVNSVETATSKTEAQALSLLQSFDTKNGHNVKILKLTNNTAVTRYWSDPASKIGRWYATSQSNYIFSPVDIIKQLALPLSNTGKFTTLYTLKNEAVVVYGLCADMTWDPINFGPTATGGGEQFFVPYATNWNAQTQTADLSPTVINLDEEIRYAKP